MLTASAKSAPLAGAWDDAEAVARSTSAPAIQRFLPTLANSRGIGGVQFGPNAPIRGTWTTDDGARGDDPAHAGRRLPATTGGRSPTTSSTTTAGNGPAATTRSGSRATRTRRSSRTPPRRSPKRRNARTSRSAITPDQLRGTYALSPAVPLQIDRPADLLGGRQGRLLPGDRDRRPRPVHDHGPGPAPGRRRRRPDPGQAPGGRRRTTRSRSSPGTPSSSPGAVGTAAQGVLDDVLQRMKAADTPDDPFDLADGPRQRAPLDRASRTRPNVLDVDCGTIEHRRVLRRLEAGYCEHYATLMTVLLREQRHPDPVRRGLPAGHARQADRRRAGLQLERPRLGRGLLPGLRLVRCSIRPGNGQDATVPLPSGKPVAERPAEPVPEPRPPDPTSGTTPTARRADPDAAGATRARRRRRAGRVHRDRGRALRGDRARRLPRLAARAARPGDARERVDRGRPARGALRLRAATDADRLRVRDGPRRGPARRPARAADGRDREGRGRLRPAGSSATTGSRRSASRTRRLRVGLLRLLFRRGDRKRLKR